MDVTFIETRWNKVGKTTVIILKEVRVTVMGLKTLELKEVHSNMVSVDGEFVDGKNMTDLNRLLFPAEWQDSYPLLEGWRFRREELKP